MSNYIDILEKGEDSHGCVNTLHFMCEWKEVRLDKLGADDYGLWYAFIKDDDGEIMMNGFIDDSNCYGYKKALHIALDGCMFDGVEILKILERLK